MQSMPARIGKYEIVNPLGYGGMGAVYKAFHPQLKRFVAIKLLLATTETDPDFIERFQREATAVAQLRHPHIVQVFDFDVQDAKPYMVMEYVEGETLAHRMTQLQRNGQTLPTREVGRIFQQLGSAVAYAHKQGMLHRDLKPQNVIINKQGDVILTDFGLVKMLSPTALTLTNAAIVGTPQYMSPEQAQGQPVDERSDIYSLGVMLFQALAGKVPFNASTPAGVLLQHVTSTPPSLREMNPQVSEKLAEITMIAMAKSPDHRFRSAAAMTNALAVAMAEIPASSNLAPASALANMAASPNVPASNMETILPPKGQVNRQQNGQRDEVKAIITPPLSPAPGTPDLQPPVANAASPLPAPDLGGLPALRAPGRATVPPASIPPSTEKHRVPPGRLVLIGLIVLGLLVGSGALAFALIHQGKQQTGVTSVGTVSFTDSNPLDFSHPANVLTGKFSGLAQPAGGSTFFGWLCDSGASTCILLGPVIVDQSGKATLTMTQATNWLGTEDAQTTLSIKITQEQTEPSAPPATPSSDVIYSGKLQSAVLVHIRHQLSAFRKAAPFQNNKTALDVGFGNDALLLQALSQQLQQDQDMNDIVGLHTVAGTILNLIAGNPAGPSSSIAGDDGFGMGAQAPQCTSGATTTYLPILIEHACYAAQAGGTSMLQHLFTLIQQAGADAARSITTIQQIARAVQQANNTNQVDVTMLMQQARQILEDAHHILTNSELMGTIILYPN